MAEINDLEIVDASNIGRFPENQAPSTVNDGARALEGIIARWHLDTNGALAAGGTADVITLAANQTLTALTTGANFTFVASGNNTGAVTVNVDAIGAVDLKTVAGAALKAGDLVADGIYNIRYDGTNYQLNASRGDVVGPAGATDKSVALYDGATGRLLKDGIAPSTSGNVLTSDGVDWTSAAPIVDITADTGTTYTTVLTDANNLVTLSDGSATALTIPTNANIPYPLGTTIAFQQIGAGLVTMSGAGVTFHHRNGLVSGGQYAVWSITKKATDTWAVAGDLTT